MESSDRKSTTILNNHKEYLYTCADEMKNTAQYRNAAVLSNDYLIDHYILDDLSDSATGRPLLCVVPDGTVLITSDVMYVQHGNPLLVRINGIIRRVLEAGLCSQWYASLKNRMKVKAREIRISSLTNEYYDLHMEHMQFALYLLFLGYALSLASFLVELTSKCVTIRCKKSKVIPLHSMEAPRGRGGIAPTHS
jgi:hypothetical protein